MRRRKAMDRAFPSNLTHCEWKLIEHLLPKARAGGRPRSTCLRNVMNAVFYLNRTGTHVIYGIKIERMKTYAEAGTTLKPDGLWRERLLGSTILEGQSEITKKNSPQ